MTNKYPLSFLDALDSLNNINCFLSQKEIIALSDEGVNVENIETIQSSLYEKIINIFVAKINDYMSEELFPYLTDLIANHTLISSQTVDQGYDVSTYHYDTKTYISLNDYKKVEDLFENWYLNYETATYISGAGLSCYTIEYEIQEELQLYISDFIAEEMTKSFSCSVDQTDILRMNDLDGNELLGGDLPFRLSLSIVEDIKELSIKDLFFIYNKPEEKELFKIFSSRH